MPVECSKFNLLKAGRCVGAPPNLPRFRGWKACWWGIRVGGRGGIEAAFLLPPTNDFFLAPSSSPVTFDYSMLSLRPMTFVALVERRRLWPVTIFRLCNETVNIGEMVKVVGVYYGLLRPCARPRSAAIVAPFATAHQLCKHPSLALYQIHDAVCRPLALASSSLL